VTTYVGEENSVHRAAWHLARQMFEAARAINGLSMFGLLCFT
jgi:hypothetical protein